MRRTQISPPAQRASFSWSAPLAACLLAMGIACSSDSGTDKGAGGQGGSSSSVSVVGGSGSGGASTTGGSSSSSSSSSSASAGTSGSSAGASTTITSSGGTASSGGRATTGGSTSQGGTSATAGKTGTGGGSGGLASTGGRSDTGGTSTTGGTTGSTKGGTTGTGGTTSTSGDRPDGGPDGRADGGSGNDSGGGTGTYNPCTAGTTCKIMPLGDSITEGCCSNTWGGYRIELFRQSVKNGKNVTFVGNLTNGPTTPIENKPFPQKHEGHGGWTISQISGIADSTLSTNKPDIVLLKIGTNDVNGTGAAGAPNGLKSLIDQITKDLPSALLVVSSIIPIKDDNTNQKVKTYNATIPTAVSAAAAAGKHVIFVDSYAAFQADSSWKTKYMGDNLHPNEAGYAVLGQTWYTAISGVLP